MRLNKLISLVVAALVASATLSTAGALAASSTLTGSGSSLVAPLVEEWGAAFQAFHGTTTSYDPAGSQGGISGISARTVDFAASDAPLSSAQAASCNNCFQIPWALSAVGIGYHVQGIRSRLFLSGSVLADIYLGQISRWNDTRIKALNPRASLPALKITPIYSPSAGDTYTFTQYLSKVSASWRSRVGSGLTVTFPTGTAANSDSAATAVLASTNGAIAYVGAPYLVAHRLPAVAIENAAGRYELPNLTEIESAGQTVKHVAPGATLQIVDPPSSARTAYPISTFIWVIVPSNAPQKSTLQQWISYALGSGQEFGPALDFGTLPSVVLRASESTLGAFGSS